MTAAEVYAGSDGQLTKAYYAELQKRGPVGIIAVNLFRAQKCSARAKLYRGRGSRGWKSEAYDRKNWSLQNLSQALADSAEQLDLCWGWKEDTQATGPYRWVLYVDLPTGQVSFHSAQRYAFDHNYVREWDGQHLSGERIMAFCDEVMKRDGAEIEQNPVPTPVDATSLPLPASSGSRAASRPKSPSPSTRLEMELVRGAGRLRL